MNSSTTASFETTVYLLATTFSKLNETDLRVLMYLHRAGIAFNCIICKHLALDPSHCHRCLRRLVASGLVEFSLLGKRKVYRLSTTRVQELGLAV